MLHASNMKFFIICLLLAVFEVQIGKAQFGGGGINLEKELERLGCPPRLSGINGNANVNAGGNNVGANANGTEITWEKYCKCLKEQLQANGNVDGKGASVDVSTPTAKCKKPSEVIPEKSGYTYKIYPERGSTWVAGSEGISLKYNPQKRNDKNDATQEITYKNRTDEEHPFLIEGTISANGVAIYTIPREEPLNSCAEQEERTWDRVVVEMWNLGLTENGECPQEPAKFHISQKLPPMEITFDDKLPCGNYTMVMWATLERYVPNQVSVVNFLMNVEWHFNIANDTSCTTESSEESK